MKQKLRNRDSYREYRTRNKGSREVGTRSERKLKWKETIDRRLNRRGEALSWLEASGTDCQEVLRTGEMRFRKSAWVLGIALPVLLFLSWLAAGSCDPSSVLQRGDYGGPAASLALKGELTVEDQSLVHDFQLEIQNRELDEEVAFALFDQCSQWLSETLPADHTVNGDLSLPYSFENGLVEICWESSDPVRINPQGQVNMLNVPGACAVVLTAVLTAGPYQQREDFILSVSTDGADYTQSLERYARALETELSESTDGESMTLPLEDGQVAIQWSFPVRKPAWLLIPLAVTVLLCLYVLRFEKLATLLKKQQDAFRHEIPAFTLQLILLLNGGLVADQAFSRLLEHDNEKDNPLYAAVRTIWRRSKEQNLSFFSELYLFARKTGMRDFIRVAAILHDNSVHGNELGSRLEQERQLLWNDRLSAAKARAKQADTKLCFPLVLLLLSLILLSAAPAFMNMK